MKLLVVTDNRFWVQKMGSQNRIHNMLEHLAKHYSIAVHFTGTFNNNDSQALAKTHFNIIESANVQATNKKLVDLVLVSKNVCEKVIKRLQGVFSSSCDQGLPVLADFFRLNEIQKLRTSIIQQRPDVILFEMLRVDYLYSTLANSECHITTVIDTHDVNYQRHERILAEGKQSSLKITKKQEQQALKKYDLVIAIQETDYDTYRQLKLANVVCSPHAIQYHRLVSLPSNSLVLGFIGSSMPSNVTGIQSFIDDVLPLLDEKRVTLNIAGNVCLALRVQAQNVVLLNKVENLKDFYQSVHATINPVTVGSGLKIKSVESICFDRPIITSPVGVEGIPKQKHQPFVVCESVEDWKNAINQLLDSNHLSALVAHCEHYATEYYSAQAAYGDLCDSIEAIVKTNN